MPNHFVSTNSIASRLGLFGHNGLGISDLVGLFQEFNAFTLQFCTIVRKAQNLLVKSMMVI